MPRGAAHTCQQTGINGNCLEWTGPLNRVRSCTGCAGPLPLAGAQLPVDCVLLLGGVAGAAAGLRRMPRGRWRSAIRGPPSSASASTSGLSRPVLPRRLWRVVGWVGFLWDVIGGVESALWEGCYPALTLAHGVCVIVYV